MKPFNLEAAKRGEPIVTRDGRKARFIAHVPEAGEAYRVVVYIEDHIDVQSYYEDGRYTSEMVSEHCDDILMASPPMRSINGHEYPESVSEPLEIGQDYYVPNPLNPNPFSQLKWEGLSTDQLYLERGLIHLNINAARAHAKAIILAGGGEV